MIPSSRGLIPTARLQDTEKAACDKFEFKCEQNDKCFDETRVYQQNQ